MSTLGRPISHHPLASQRNNASEKMTVDEDPVDAGIIRCICASTDDDGFTIQCERCFVWQHAYCVDISQSSIPDHYLCDKCSKLYPDLKRSMDLENLKNGLPRLQDDQTPHDLPHSEKKRLQTASDALLQRRKFEKSKNKFGHSKRSREFPTEDYQPVSSTAARKPKLSKRISIPRQKLKDLEADEDMFSKIKRRKSAVDVSSPVAKSTVKCKFVKQIFRDARDRWKQPTNRCVKMDADALRPSVLKIAVHPLSKVKSETSLANGHRSPRKGVFAQARISSNQFLIEAIGDVVLKSGYKFDASNNYVSLGTAKACVLFYPEVDLCIDARRYGNEARHIRRSCHPSAELKNIIIPQTKDTNAILLGVFSRDTIQKGQEITLGWSWQKGHISWKKNMDWHHRGGGMDDRHQVIDEEEERKSRRAIRNMLESLSEEFGSCACKDRSSCLIEYLKRENGAKGSISSEVIQHRQDQNRHVDENTGNLAETKSSYPTSDPHHGQQASDTIPPAENNTHHVTFQHSRQIIVTTSSGKNNISDSSSQPAPPTDGLVEENIDIDVISTSPRTTNSDIVSEGEEELDVDGEIDVGEELPSVQTASQRNDGNDDISSNSSLTGSSSSEDEFSDEEKSSRRLGQQKTSTRPAGNKHLVKRKNAQTNSTSLRDNDTNQHAEEAKARVLPPKKFWMKKCLQHDVTLKKSNDITSTAANDIVKRETQTMETVIETVVTSDNKPADSASQLDTTMLKGQKDNEATEKEENVAHAAEDVKEDTAIEALGNAAPKAEERKSMFNETSRSTIGSQDMDVDDGALSDASSASTLPLEEEDIDK